MKSLRFGIWGTGFWSRFQLAAWREFEGVECVALTNRTRSKAEALAKEFGIPAVYDTPEEMLDREKLDFVDIITDVGTHAPLVKLAASRKVPVICQKPMGTTLEEATEMVKGCKEVGVPFFIHENWRWQRPIRELKRIMETNDIGYPFRARITFSTSFPVFDNQPFLKELDQFILTDIGSHILDVARFLFGEAQSLYCQTRRIHQDIKGEDVATVMMNMGDKVTVVCEMSYASRLERERFPQTYVVVEGSKGSVELTQDYWIRVTTETGTHTRRYPPTRYQWADPAYDLVHSSIVPCNGDLLKAIRGEGKAETTGEDNLKTVQLVFKSYESAKDNRVIELR
jgi:D-apiose dehydrogenase